MTSSGEKNPGILICTADVKSKQFRDKKYGRHKVVKSGKAYVICLFAFGIKLPLSVY